MNGARGGCRAGVGVYDAAESHHSRDRAGTRRAAAGVELRACDRRREAPRARSVLATDDAAARDAAYRHHARSDPVLLAAVARYLLPERLRLQELRRPGGH